MRHTDRAPSPSLQLARAPLLTHLGGSVLRSEPVKDALRGDTGIQALVEAGRLHADEAALARALPESRRGTFVAGRLALREALREVMGESGNDGPRRTADLSILRNDRGAPALPHTVSGSITHKASLALAVMAPRPAGPNDRLQFVGVDLEHRPTPADLGRPSIARRILTARELQSLQDRREDALAEREAVLVHFAIKEAVYKAIDPFVHRYVRFTEVELALRETGATSGAMSVTLLLPELAGTDIEVRAQWHLDGDWIVATAFSTRSPADGSG